jgi:hypothetical protein
MNILDRPEGRLTISEYALAIGKHYATIEYRLKSGMPIENGWIDPIAADTWNEARKVKASAKHAETARKMQAALTPEQRSEAGRRMRAAITPGRMNVLERPEGCLTVDEYAIKAGKGYSAIWLRIRLGMPTQNGWIDPVVTDAWNEARKKEVSTIHAENMRKWHAASTPEERTETARKRQAARTPEQLAWDAQKMRASRTPEERSQTTRKWRDSLTPEQWDEVARKGRATRAARKAKGATA